MRFSRRRASVQRPAPQPVLSDLNDAERQYVDNQLAAAHIIANRYLGLADSPPSLEQLDRMIEAWLADSASDRLDINAVANATGATLGNHLSSDVGLAWVIAADDDGTDLALHGQPGNILIYPANAVAKRLAEDESGFLVPLAQALSERIRSLRNGS